ncbi:glucosamine-6-phosphate deaminase [Metabacillus fastidiosus]|uniref:glucosamine-6-phosphate deaminase n=1 Tax=Metabacillus fastidiosus TaxID=1458 RepID=UPI003D2C6919
MKLIVVKNSDEMSKLAAEKMLAVIKEKFNATIGLATGGTPKGVYAELRKDHQANGTSYGQIKTVNLDEYVGLSPDDPNSYHYYMNEEFLSHINIKEENIHLPNGIADDLQTECKRYEEIISSLGGIDLQLLGIGHNGHIGFNEPGTSFESRTHLVHLTEETIQANSRYFDSIDDVPTKALTMGIKTILESNEIILVANGKEKAKAIKFLVEDPIDELVPASALRSHANVTIIVDEAAASLLQKEQK